MPSGNPTASAHVETGTLRSLLGSAAGFYVWAAHLLIVYMAQAVACQLAVVSVASPGRGLIMALAIFTVLAAVLVIIHGRQQWRQRHGTNDTAFLARLAAGQDAIAALAILWQLIPLFTVPLCR